MQTLSIEFFSCQSTHDKNLIQRSQRQKEKKICKQRKDESEEEEEDWQKQGANVWSLELFLILRSLSESLLTDSVNKHHESLTLKKNYSELQ